MLVEILAMDMNPSAGRGMSNNVAGSMKGKAPETARHNDISASSSHVGSPTSEDRICLSGMSDVQWKHWFKCLTKLRKSNPIDPFSGKFFLESWIIDSGAINHMTGTLDFSMDIFNLAPVLIKLPDDRFTTSTKSGRVQLSSSPSLQE